MKCTRKHIVWYLLLALLVSTAGASAANIDVEGDFRLRAYSDGFSNARDDRGTENYMRYRARIRARAQVDQGIHFYTELATWTENNPVTPVRNIAGTGRMKYGISQIFGEIVRPNVLVFDVIRARVGRQQFPIGNGLSQGESSYFVDKFDGIRFDLAYHDYTLALFGAITEQNVSESGLYPDPGSDQLYIARLSRALGSNHTVMGYYLYNKLQGNFNDSYILGGGVSGNFMRNRLGYFAEMAFQSFNTLDGLPDKGGMGYMAGISYRWTMGPFKSVKVETRYAAYEGDDADTDEIEIFSPLYPSFYWGSRRGYVDGAIGGDFPYDGRNPEGSRLWYTRFYVIPKSVPNLRVQFQFIKIDEFVDNDGYNSMDNEFSIKAYYRLSRQAQVQLRFARNFPNDDDYDLNDSGQITWSEDRVNQTRFMSELVLEF